MNKENLILLIFILLLLAGMFYTLLADGNRSRHGYGLHHQPGIGLQQVQC